MTEVTMNIIPGGEAPCFQLVVCGQAADAPSSLPAAESTLMQALCCRLAQAGAAFLQDLAVDGVPGRGWCAVTAQPTVQGLQYVHGAFELAALGFTLLARQYPGCVSVQLGDGDFNGQPAA
ncbi:MAG: hypothetical protein IJ347_00830 [Faecalibacterium sp.]|nr:hypothetical protein [Faecalibacterium sp.]